MINVLEFGLVVSEFELKLSPSLSEKYSWESYEPPYPPSYELDRTTTVIQEGWISH